MVMAELTFKQFVPDDLNEWTGRAATPQV